jgi:hypothetical protein
MHIDNFGNIVSNNSMPIQFVNYLFNNTPKRNEQYDVDSNGDIYFIKDSIGEFGQTGVEYHLTRYIRKLSKAGAILWDLPLPYSPTTSDVTFLDIDEIKIINDTIILMGESVYDTYADSGYSATLTPTVLFYNTSGNLIYQFISQETMIENSPPEYSDNPIEYFQKAPNGEFMFLQQFVQNNIPKGYVPLIKCLNPTTSSLAYEVDLLHILDPGMDWFNLVWTPEIVAYPYPAGEMSFFCYFRINESNYPADNGIQFRLDDTGNILYVNNAYGINIPNNQETDFLNMQNGMIHCASTTGTYNSGFTPIYNRWCYNCSENISGKVYYDSLNDCVDIGDYGLPNILVSVDSGLHYFFTDTNGEFISYLDPGPHNLAPTSNQLVYWYSNCGPMPLNVNAPASPNMSSGNEIPFFPLPNVHDLKLFINGTVARPGFQTNTYLTLKNQGTVNESGVLELFYDSILFTFDYAIPTPDSSGFGYVSWNYNNIPIFGSNDYLVTLTVGGVIGDTFTNSAQAGDLLLDTIPNDNINSFTDTIIGSFDPNDKQVFPKGTGPEGFITPYDTLLEYLVRFQNTGTDTAFTVRIEDDLDLDLDISTLQIGLSSHPYTVQLHERKLIFTFNNILLPDSGTDFAGSNGMIQYFIEQNPSLTRGTEIKNTAEIYFDFNAAVVTNTVINTIEWATGTDEEITSLQESVLKAYPNPFSGALYVEWNYLEPIRSLSLWNLQGQLIGDFTNLTKGLLSGKTEIGIQNADIPNGIYFLKVETETGIKVLKLAKQ